MTEPVYPKLGLMPVANRGGVLSDMSAPEGVFTNQFKSQLVHWGALAGNGAIALFKGMFEVATWITVLWWALPLKILFEKIQFRAGVVVIKQIPNALSVVRILVSPIIGWWLALAVIDGNQSEATHWFVVMGALALLDGIDGPAARHLDAVSNFGKVIDPAADKVLFAVMVIGYCVVTQSVYGWWAFVPLLIITLWAARVELALAQMPLQFKPLLDSLGLEHPGANIFGKVKFNLQMLAVFTGWWWIIGDPNNVAGALWTVMVLFVARYFADKSLGRHRMELVELQYLAAAFNGEPVAHPGHNYTGHLVDDIIEDIGHTETKLEFDPDIIDLSSRRKEA